MEVRNTEYHTNTFQIRNSVFRLFEIPVLVNLRRPQEKLRSLYYPRAPPCFSTPVARPFHTTALPH